MTPPQKSSGALLGATTTDHTATVASRSHGSQAGNVSADAEIARIVREAVDERRPDAILALLAILGDGVARVSTGLPLWPRMMRARHHGRCVGCQRAVRAGERIAWYETGRLTHAECDEAYRARCDGELRYRLDHALRRRGRAA